MTLPELTGSESIYELCKQPEGDYYGNPDLEIEVYENRSYAVGQWFDKRSARSIDNLLEFVVRCPEGGCALAELFCIGLPEGGERFIAIAHQPSKRRAGFANWAFSDGWAGYMLYFPCICRHGQARVGRAWLMDVCGYVRGWKHALETEEAFQASIPAEIKRGIPRRTFHPENWRPHRAGSATVGDTS